MDGAVSIHNGDGVVVDEIGEFTIAKREFTLGFQLIEAFLGLTRTRTPTLNPFEGNFRIDIEQDGKIRARCKTMDFPQPIEGEIQGLIGKAREQIAIAKNGLACRDTRCNLVMVVLDTVRCEEQAKGRGGKGMSGPKAASRQLTNLSRGRLEGTMGSEAVGGKPSYQISDLRRGSAAINSF